MKLTITERMILANQYDILWRIAKDPHEKQEYAHKRAIVESGYEGHYQEIAGIIAESILTDEEGTEALDIMTMYSCLKSSYENLSDKSGIDESNIKFRGFDGNNEGKLLSYAQFFCSQSGGRFTDIITKEVPNSHGPYLAMYRRMLVVFEALPEREHSPNELSKESIQKVLASQIHPENRK